MPKTEFEKFGSNNEIPVPNIENLSFDAKTPQGETLVIDTLRLGEPDEDGYTHRCTFRNGSHRVRFIQPTEKDIQSFHFSGMNLEMIMIVENPMLGNELRFQIVDYEVSPERTFSMPVLDSSNTQTYEEPEQESVLSQIRGESIIARDRFGTMNIDPLAPEEQDSS